MLNCFIYFYIPKYRPSERRLHVNYWSGDGVYAHRRSFHVEVPPRLGS
jgi:hypothetical protein